MALPLDASALARELGAEPPPALTELLSAEERRMLAETLDAAKRRQSAALDTAIREALSHVPFVFRGTVELILT